MKHKINIVFEQLSLQKIVAAYDHYEKTKLPPAGTGKKFKRN